MAEDTVIWMGYTAIVESEHGRIPVTVLQMKTPILFATYDAAAKWKSKQIEREEIEIVPISIRAGELP